MFCSEVSCISRSVTDLYGPSGRARSTRQSRTLVRTRKDASDNLENAVRTIVLLDCSDIVIMPGTSTEACFATLTGVAETLADVKCSFRALLKENFVFGLLSACFAASVCVRSLSFSWYLLISYAGSA